MKLRQYLLFALLTALLVLGVGCLDGSDEEATPATGETPAGETPVGEQPSGEQPTGEQPSGEQPTGEQPSGEEPGGEQPTGEEPAPVTGQPLPDPTEITPDPIRSLTPGSTVVHTIEPGEWLHQITRCYGASYVEVLKRNALYNPNYLYPGRTLTIPNIGSAGAITGPPCIDTYFVQAGDTWDDLGSRYQTEAKILQMANPGVLLPGREIYVPSNTPALTETPQIATDLLFNLDGDLTIWEADSDNLAVYATTPVIVDLVTNAAGEWVLQQQISTADGGAEMALVNRTIGTITVIESGLDGSMIQSIGENMLISPDGQWGVYLVPEGEMLRITTFPTSAPDTQKSVSVAHGIDGNLIPQLFPGSDNSHFLLLDDTGIYEYDYALNVGETQLRPTPDIEDADPDEALAYSAKAWSPTGRYLLLQGYFFEGASHFVYDRQTNSLQNIPNSISYIIQSTATWLPDGTLVTLNPPQAQGAAGPLRTTYTFQAVEESFELVEGSRETLVLPSGRTSPEPGYAIAAPAVQPSGQLLMVIWSDRSDNSGLWGAQEGRLDLIRLNTVPQNVGVTNWAPDGSAVLISTFGTENQAGEVTAVPADGSTPFSIIDWLGFQVSNFSWIE